LIQKVEGLKTTLWTGLLLCLVFVALNFTQPMWVAKLALIEQMNYGLLVVGVLFSAQFNRTRVTITLLLLLAYYCYALGLIAIKIDMSLHQQWAFIAVLFTFAYLGAVKDRGVLSVHGLLRIVGIAACIALAKAWLVVLSLLSQYNAQHQWLNMSFESLAINIPLYCVSLFLLYKSLRNPNLVVASLLALVVIGHLVFQQLLLFPLELIVFIIAIHLILVVVVDSYFLAYRDELTNLPSRRALNQYALSLGGKYCVAMIDIDHFKKFNDTYGHDIGDQVLKLVAAKLAKIKSGGRVFRYGGEEFTAIFPRKLAEQAIDELEHLRQVVADYDIVIRHPLRKTKKARQNSKSDNFKTVSVTISLGVANRLAKQTFEQVVKQADLALYRAKKKGRNNVSF